MAENKKMVYPHEGPYKTCLRCGCYTDENSQAPYRRITIGAYNNSLCNNCFNELYMEMGKALHKAVDVGDTVYVLRTYDDGHWWNWGIFPMTVKKVQPCGAIKHTSDGYTIWHICLEDEHIAVRMNFCEIDKTVFLTEEEARAALDQKNMQH